MIFGEWRVAEGKPEGLDLNEGGSKKLRNCHYSLAVREHQNSGTGKGWSLNS